MRQPTGDPVLRVSRLTTVFRTDGKRFHAVRDVSLELRRGEKLGVVGESGCGKSALALSILRLIEHPGEILAGEIVLSGRRVDQLGDRELSSVRGREIALVHSDPMAALDPVATIGRQLCESILRHQPEVGRRQARRRAAELLEEVEVPSATLRLDEYPHQCSGGIRQRVIIAMALANEPDVVIADEPTTALDVTTQVQVLDVLDRMTTERGTAVILITHDLGVVRQFCDRVHVMYAGRIVERATTEAMFSRPAHPYSEALLRATPRLGRRLGTLPTIPGIPPSLDALAEGCAFADRCPASTGVCYRDAPPTVDLAASERGGEVECHFPRVSELTPSRSARTRAS